MSGIREVAFKALFASPLPRGVIKVVEAWIKDSTRRHKDTKLGYTEVSMKNKFEILKEWNLQR